MSPYGSLLWLWIFSVGMMTGGWLWQRRHRNAGIVDALWAVGLGVGALLLAVLGDGAMWPRIALALAGGLWSARLAVHLASRVFGEPEDGRYRAMREHWQTAVQARFFLVFQVQTLVIVLLALPFLAVARNPQTNAAWLIVGAVIWLASVAGEALADRQLAAFRADPNHHGRTCRRGLWRYSRHPNYFCESLHWFAYVAFAIGSPLWWLSWIGPVAMYLFLRYLTGVPWAEMQALRSRGDDYRAYQRSTPMLFPWLPKSDRGAANQPEESP